MRILPPGIEDVHIGIGNAADDAPSCGHRRGLRGTRRMARKREKSRATIAPIPPTGPTRLTAGAGDP